jgi:excisionase family DNA binding protein
MVKTCKVLGISRRTAYYWIQNGRLQTTRTPLGSQRVLMDSLKAAWTSKFQ